ncbi:tubulin epsilon and delta complex protein 1 isoform X7 [Manis pentadactyla]|uniref:tubulin epsilon and delta complex protein 1 isoform X7 n=1 Tax=Manis pentadactyla TaxID=143292 RepID=UPI00255C6024|nr:tubulin epsilon and delta complex protein 1 isoform X7 [Manis pentadactyla]
MGRRRRRGGPEDAAGALPEAIAALSRTLPAGPSPETFRRAKFDRPEAAPALWRLLLRVLSPLPVDGATAPLAPEAEARAVRSALRSRGYPRWTLAQLPDDGAHGSRELLLALAWLLARGPLLEQLLVQTRLRLGDEMPVCECKALASPGWSTPRVEADSGVDVRHLQWLMGKLRFRWRNLMIHLYTSGCHGNRSLGHLSVAETELLRDPEGGRQDTVLGACPLEASQPSSLPRIPEQGAGELQLVAQELQALLEELQEAVETRRSAWEAGIGGRGPAWSAVRQALQEAVGQELAALQQAWEPDQGLAQACPHGPHRLVRSEAGVPGEPGGLGLQAAEVIGALRSREACLEAVLHQLQGQCRQELARLAGALPGLIWIPPPRRFPARLPGAGPPSGRLDRPAAPCPRAERRRHRVSSRLARGPRAHRPGPAADHGAAAPGPAPRVPDHAGDHGQHGGHGLVPGGAEPGPAQDRRVHHRAGGRRVLPAGSALRGRVGGCRGAHRQARLRHDPLVSVHLRAGDQALLHLPELQGGAARRG